MTGRRSVRIALLLLTAAVCLLLARRLDHRRVVAAFEEVDWRWVAAAAVINIANTIVEAWRWVQVASPLRRGIRTRSAFLAIVSGVAGGLVLPFKLGDGVKAYVFAKTEHVGVPQSIGTVVADRLSDLLAFAVIALAAWFTISLPGPVGTAVHWVSGGLAAVLALVVGLAAARPLREWLQRPVRHALAVSAGRALDALARFGAGVPLARVGVAAFASWFLRGAVVWAMMQAFHLGLPALSALITLIVINVGIAVTGVPGNVGSFEIATVGALELFKVPLETTVSYGIALHATELLPLLAIGALLALTGIIDIDSWAGAVSPGDAR